MTIVQNGDPALRRISTPVEKEEFGTPELLKLLADMTTALNAEPDGVALAAPQIGVNKRIFIVRYDRMSGPEEPTHEAQVGVFINPSFVRSSRRTEEMDEGCLSVRGIYGTTLRHPRATVRAYDEHGRKFERGGGGILAQAFQHEIDHLDGKLFIDHATTTREIEREV